MAAIKSHVHYAWLILIGCCFVQFGTLGGLINAAGCFYVPIREELGFGSAEIAGWLSCCYVVSALSMPIIGRFIERWNYRAVSSISLGITILAFGFMGLYHSAWLWYLSGVIIGLFGAFFFMCATPILLGNWFHKKAGTAIGIAMACSALGGAVWAPLATGLISMLGWRMAYGVIAVIVAVMVLPWCLFVLRFRPEDMGLKPYGYEETTIGPSNKTSSFPGVPYSKAIRTLPFVLLFVFAGVDALFGGYTSHLPSFAATLGFQNEQGSLFLSLCMIGCVVGQVLSGALTDRFGAAKPAIGVLVLVIISFLGMMTSTSYGVLCACMFIFGFNGASISVSLPAIITEIYGNKDLGPILSLTRAGTGVFGALGPAGVGLCYDLSGSYFGSFVIGAIVMACCVVMLLLCYAQKDKMKSLWTA